MVAEIWASVISSFVEQLVALTMEVGGWVGPGLSEKKFGKI